MSNTVTAIVVIQNKLGLHARPAMLFVEAANGFDAEITVRRSDQSEAVNGKSIMHMMMLAATHGTDVEICATGTDAQAAVTELVKLVESKFREE